MDYSTREVHIHELPLSFEENPEAFVVTQFSNDGKTFSLSDTDYMVVDLKKNEGRLPFYIH